MQIKIIATLGPATQEESQMKELIESGVSVLRINMSHGSPEWTETAIKNIRSAGNARIMLDTKGPEIRVSKTETKELSQGEEVLFAYEKDVTSTEIIPLSYPGIASILKEGNEIIIDSGKIIAIVKSIQNNIISTEITQSGKISSGRHVNLPGVYIDLPILTDSDKENIRIAAPYQFEKLALSFVRNKEDIDEVRAFLRSLRLQNTKIIAKIEHVAALEHLEEIIDAADEIMVARGDLGVETPWYKIAIEEEQIIQTCKEHKKPVIVATQMLLSMQENAIPTRAEVMDVTIAVQLGANFIMLSDETTVGKYPKETVQAMKKIAEYAEQFPIKENIFQTPTQFS